jgi:hypothetical protein
VEAVKLLQLVTEATRMDPALQLIMGQLNKLTASQEAMKNDNEGKINTNQDKIKKSISDIHTSQNEMKIDIQDKISDNQHKVSAYINVIRSGQEEFEKKITETS